MLNFIMPLRTKGEKRVLALIPYKGGGARASDFQFYSNMTLHGVCRAVQFSTKKGPSLSVPDKTMSRAVLLKRERRLYSPPPV